MSEKRKLNDEPQEDAQDGVHANAENGSSALVLSKRPKTNDSNSALTVASQKGKELMIAGPPRTSKLMAPTMCLTGHQSAVYSVKFSDNGSYVASAGADNLILLWETYGECRNFGVLRGHKAAVLQSVWQKGNEFILSASADKTAALWDVEANTRIKQFKHHKAVVNTVCISRSSSSPVIASGSDDCTFLLWDARTARRPQASFSDEFQILSLDFSEDGNQIFSAGIDPEIKCWDLRTNKIMYKLAGHRDSVTGIRVSPDGTHLLSNAMDNTARVWDIRPYISESASGRRDRSICMGATHDMQQERLRAAWSPDSKRISVGSADRFVWIWDAFNGQLLYKLPGHRGSVNDVDFHPLEPIIASCSSDKQIWLGELV